jgi:hypothetical protein
MPFSEVIIRKDDKTCGLVELYLHFLEDAYIARFDNFLVVLLPAGHKLLP